MKITIDGVDLRDVAASDISLAIATLQQTIADRQVMENAEVASLDLVVSYLSARDREFEDEDGPPPWVQPTGAHDAYPLDWQVVHQGKIWTSLRSANPDEPGSASWREEVPEGGGPATWVQPTGAHDAYSKGDVVTFEGSNYESLINANTWSPTAYPQGWKLIDPTEENDLRSRS